jgi:hypothetical protein
VRIFEGQGVSEKSVLSSELKTSVQQENEAIFTENLTKVLNNFVHHLQEICNFWGITWNMC